MKNNKTNDKTIHKGDNKEEKTVRFDMIISFDAKDRKKEFEDISKEIVDALPEYKFYINMDTDFSEL